MQIHHNYPLKKLNTFGFDIKALHYAEPSTLDELQELLSDPIYKSMPHIVIGGGSNILFRNDYDGLVIHPKLSGIERIREDDQQVVLKVGAGIVWDDFVAHCVDHNLGGIENLSGIPGTVGASPVQNIGAYGVEVKDTIVEVHAIRMEDLKRITFNKADCRFGYRDSIFKQEWNNKLIILSVSFSLSKVPVLTTHYGAIADILKNNQQASISDLRNAILQIRDQKLPDHAKAGNVGSFFKNPTILKSKAAPLTAAYPNLTVYPVDDLFVKIPAGWLIEQCGWKGKKVGDVGVHSNQALVLVNYGQGTGEQIIRLASAIQKSVMEKFGITLEMEVNIV